MESGTTYDLTWESALSYTPQRYGGETVVEMPWVQIITWNDFPEGTAVEPRSGGVAGVVQYNASFDYARRWHGSSSSSSSSSPGPLPEDTPTQAVNAAVGILRARRAQDGRAAAAAAHFVDGNFTSALAALEWVAPIPSTGASSGSTSGGESSAPSPPAAGVTEAGGEDDPVANLTAGSGSGRHAQPAAYSPLMWVSALAVLAVLSGLIQ